MFEKKQNVFDDWFAAAEYLIANKYTSPAALRHHRPLQRRPARWAPPSPSARSSSRPSAAAIPCSTCCAIRSSSWARYWTTEYGSADNEKQFFYLLKYSPYQNVKPGTAYPAVMFFTGDSDTRVDPLHARKMTRLLQSASSSGRPVLLHYSLTGGHSAGVGCRTADPGRCRPARLLVDGNGPSPREEVVTEANSQLAPSQVGLADNYRPGAHTKNMEFNPGLGRETESPQGAPPPPGGSSLLFRFSERRMGASTLDSYICRTEESRFLDKTLLEPFFKSNGINAHTLKSGQIIGHLA